MGKDPAFLFYPNDYIGGTMGMTFEEKGAYMEVLMMQFNRGHMTEHMIRQVIGHNWDTVKVKFIQDDKGLWYNKRLEEEKEKRKRFVNSRKNNISGKNQYSKKTGHKKGHMTSHMENENENENKNLGNINEFKHFFKENGYTEESAEKAWHYYNDNNWKDKNGNEVKNWKNKCRNNWFKPEYKKTGPKLAI